MEKLKPLPIEAKLTAVKQLTPDVFEYHYEPLVPFQFYPGQFVSVIVPGAGPGGRDLRRAYSIASGPELTRSGKSVFELCVKLVEGGPGTTYLNAVKVGESIKGIAPYGDFVYKTRGPKHVIFVATGTGIAPFRAMLQSQVYAENKPLSCKLLFGARVESDLLYTDLPGIVPVLSRAGDSWKGIRGRVTDWLRNNETSIDWAHTDFYLCGNGAMIDEVKSILTGKGVEKTSIHQEVYYKPKPGETHAN